MSDTPSSPSTPGTTTPPPANPQIRSDIDQSLLDELVKTGQILAVANKPAYLAKLTSEDGGLDAEFFTELATDVKTANETVGQATQNTTGKLGATSAETAAKKKLLAAIRSVQKRAKQKYERKNKTVLKDYYVGDKIESSRQLLETAARGISDKLKTDTLPGITAAKKTALQSATVAYVDCQTDQSTAQSEATTIRQELKAAVDDIARRRRELQLAADDLWPHTTKTNAGIRAEFKLPPDKALK
jgi:hypothetical protein